MSMNVSEFVWQRLGEWGLNRVYGYPSDGVGVLDVALEQAEDRMEYVQVRHEEMAAFMPSAHAKFTGQVGLSDEALAADRPVNHEADTDPELGSVLRNSGKELLAGVLPGKR